MCGIIGYIGNRNVLSILMDGLKRLEYRGYDSAGIAYFSDGKLEVRRSAGKLSSLEAILPLQEPKGSTGIGHTRWATHGRPTEENAHPHSAGTMSIVHNGIIENHISLKKDLQAKGHTFISDTDTEVITRLINQLCQEGLPIEEALQHTIDKIRGSFAICLLSEKEPDRLIAVRSGCPLVLGAGEKESFVASDIPAFLSHTREIIFMEDGEIAILSPEGIEIHDLKGKKIVKPSQQISWDPVMAEKGGYRHFMQKEIYEQPRAITDTIRGRIDHESGNTILGDPDWDHSKGLNCRRAVLVGCGTSWHAALVGKFLLEGIAKLPVEVDIASEFRYRDPHLSPDDWVIGISQSGETADTLAAMKEARNKKAPTLSICNVVGSSISRETDSVFYTHAGPEISVASTKAFTTQLTALTLLAINLGRRRGVLSEEEGKRLIHHLVLLPKQIESILQRENKIKEIANRYFRHRDFLFLGRSILYPVALEGALKLKEVSYIHAEGYPAGEMKHGPIALIDEEMPVVIMAPKDHVYEKTVSNIMEVKARGGIIIALVEEEDHDLAEIADEVIPLPKTLPCLSPILSTVPLQLLAYHIAVHRGSDVDQPRNLAKSVTVE
ncbi:MAG: glutamine--fructose-6-phosphate transaminase (isomerizing) [Nitrospira sp.]|nr:glutamine--fructose-6-phosphate transaminase (isomerizing) [Candidatus Manganitrophaceae bacterium]HIL34457.1 glutamine--fructose-6-phosphate transaminase (isomerizing) [Candidatus Manganitrophaceae bacterium]